MIVNYHTHCKFCDGKGEPEEYVLNAIKLGFHSLGFSSHAPLKEINDWTLKEEDVENYLKEIQRLKEKYKSEIKIYTGLEIDYYPDENRFKTFSKLNLDYTIGSIHMLKPKNSSRYYSVDENLETFEELIRVFGGMENVTRNYYKHLRNMIESQGFDILGHIDLLKKFNKGNKYFKETEPWYIEEIIKTLDTISSYKVIVEMNTGALSRGWQDDPYPSEWIVKECKKRDIKMCLNSDAHVPTMLDCNFKESIKNLEKCGYRELTTPFEVIDIRSYYG